MKKILATVLATTMVFSMIACGNNNVNETTESEVVSTETVSTETAATETTTTESATTETTSTETEETIGEAALAAFETFAPENPDATAEEVANGIIPVLESYFGPAVMPVEEGLLNGFDNAEIKGFEEGVMFAPMIGTIPFVGYIFTLADDADSGAFITMLEESANPRWNVCTVADEMFASVSGNKVFFLMSPSKFE